MGPSKEIERMKTETSKSGLNDVEAQQAPMQSIVSVRTYDWIHKDQPIRYPNLTDKEMAAKVRMLTSGDLDHEPVVCGARDRIMALAKEKERFASLLLAAKYLILAAEGPDGGPTNWNDTRDDWMRLIAEDGIDTEAFIESQSH